MKFHVADNACVASGDAVEGDMVVGVVSGQFGGWLRRTSVIMVFLLSACVLLVLSFLCCWSAVGGENSLECASWGFLLAFALLRIFHHCVSL